MTNTGDFRRYSVASDVNISIDRYFSASRSSAAPKYEPRKEEKPDLRVGGNSKKKSRKQIVREQKNAFSMSFSIVVTAILVVAMLFGAISTMSRKNELTKEIGRYERELTIAQSENVRLNSQLDSLVSMNMIDKYAVEKLKMSKVAGSQMRYMDVSQYKAQQQAMLEEAEKNAEE